jgi:hypothetical protein
MEIIYVEWDQAFKKGQQQMVSSKEMTTLDEMFRNQLSVQERERKILAMEKNAPKRASTEDADSSEDRQEPTIKIKSKIDNKKSDDEMHQFITSVETENLSMICRSRSRSRSIGQLKSKRSRTFNIVQKRATPITVAGAAAVDVNLQSNQDGGHLCYARRTQVVCDQRD